MIRPADVVSSRELHAGGHRKTGQNVRSSGGEPALHSFGQHERGIAQTSIVALLRMRYTFEARLVAPEIIRIRCRDIYIGRVK